jgi:uncharacterized protein (DUF2342 family)
VHPLKYMQERAEKEGSRLSGMAFSIATSTAHLQGIASRALGETAPAAAAEPGNLIYCERCEENFVPKNRDYMCPRCRR